MNEPTVRDAVRTNQEKVLDSDIIGKPHAVLENTLDIYHM